MLKQFYEKALPRQGVYCVTGINPSNKKANNRFAETLDEALNIVEKLKEQQQNVYVALGTFDGYSRKAENCLFYRTFFIDLDCGVEKAEVEEGYLTKEDAIHALEGFVENNDMPPPVVVDSGTGIHAYWMLDEDVPIADYLPYAEKWKSLVLDQLLADPSVMADAARIMRCPDTLNYKTDPPSPSKVLSEEINEYSFAAFKEFLGEVELSEKDILAKVSKGLDEETRRMLGMDNYVYTFEELALKSLEGRGCGQIQYMLENPQTVPRDQWAAGLTVAVKCADGETAIHKMSEDYEGYDYNETEKTAHSFDGTRTCDWFAANYPAQCEGCQYRGRIKAPILLGREFKAAASANKEDAVWETPSAEKVPLFPEFLRPYIRGVNGGIYAESAPKTDKKGNTTQDDPVLILTHDLYPIRRLYSPLDGECLMMRLLLPNDAPREFLLPMKNVYSQEEFKRAMASNGVIYRPAHLPLLTDYIVKWDQYMINYGKADIMRMQMGWTEDPISEHWDKRSFVLGNREITHTGEVINAPMSPFVKGLSRHLIPVGSYEKWKTAANMLNQPGLEPHAFGMLCGFGSPLMCYTSTSGVSVCFTGRSGNAKTGAMYAGLSVYGNPKDLSVFEATENALTQRYLGLHNLMFGLDEVGNKEPKAVSQTIHKVSHGKAKIRMQASVNAEREHEMVASLICMLTSNEALYNRLEELKASPDGEAARLVEFIIGKPSILEGEGGGEMGRQIFDTFRTNFGHAIVPFIQHLYKLGDTWIRERMEYWRAKFIADFGEDNSYRFYENLILSTFTSGDIANDAGIVSFDLERIYKDIVGRMLFIRKNIITVNKIDFPSILGDFILQNLPNTLVIRDGHMTYEPRGQLVARSVSDDNLYQVSKTKFKQYLRERRINEAEFEHDMKERGSLIEIKRGRLTAGWKGAAQSENVWMYCFKSSLPEITVNEGEPDH